jgi:hypothetical protein
MITRLQSDHRGRISRKRPRRRQRLSFSVRLALALVIPLPDNPAGRIKQDAATAGVSASADRCRATSSIRLCGASRADTGTIMLSTRPEPESRAIPRAPLQPQRPGQADPQPRTRQPGGPVQRHGLAGTQAAATVRQPPAR